MQNYIDILEKTNQQLSLWYNPYGVMVAILGVFFTILAIAAAFIIYRQSRDYKDKVEADREFYRKKMQEFLEVQTKIIEGKSRTAKELSEKTDHILREYKKKLEKSSKSQKEEIQKAIDKLELEKLTIKNDIGPITVTPNFDNPLSTVSLFDKKLHKCSHCGFNFYIDTNPIYSGVVLSTRSTVTCPKCNNIDSTY